MTPADFRGFVHGIADRVGLACSRVILGGDHLGPNPWRHLPADEAMQKAEAMVAAYAGAGLEKLHLDCSMGCAGDPASPGDAVAARRAACLAARAEASGDARPVYVIGTEVPTPGGTTEALDHLQPTRPDAVLVTHAIHEEAFHGVSGGKAWRRVIAIVVQPGVEFGHEEVAVYAPGRARLLAAALDGMLAAFDGVRIPGTLISQHLPRLRERVMAGQVRPDGRLLLIEAVRDVLRTYSEACRA